MLETKGIDRALEKLNDYLQTEDAFDAYKQLAELERLAEIGSKMEEIRIALSQPVEGPLQVAAIRALQKRRDNA